MDVGRIEPQLLGDGVLDGGGVGTLVIGAQTDVLVQGEGGEIAEIGHAGLGEPSHGLVGGQRGGTSGHPQNRMRAPGEHGDDVTSGDLAHLGGVLADDDLHGLSSVSCSDAHCPCARASLLDAVHAAILTWRAGHVGSSVENQYRRTLRPSRQNTISQPRVRGASNPMSANQPSVCQPTPRVSSQSGE